MDGSWRLPFRVERGFLVWWCCSFFLDERGVKWFPVVIMWGVLCLLISFVWFFYPFLPLFLIVAPSLLFFFIGDGLGNGVINAIKKI